MSQSNNVAVVRRVFEEAINQVKPDLAAELFHPEYVDHHPIPGQPVGAAAGPFIVRHLAERSHGRPNVVVHEILGEGDLVAARWTAGPPPRSGGKPAIEVLVLLRFADGKVIERWAAFNRADA